MSDILDDQVCNLLRDAEERLRADVTSARLEPNRAEKNVSAVETREAPKAPLTVRQPRAHELARGYKKDTAGPDWFNLPKTDLTPEFKRDWQLLRMRGLLDPKHQKKALHSNPPAYSRIAEVLPGPADFQGSKVTRKERKKTIFEEMTSSHDGQKLKSKYAGIQRSKTSGKRAFYQRLISHRRKAHS